MKIFDMKYENILFQKYKNIFSYRAFMRFLPGMSPHMNDQHVLSFEWLLLSRTIFPLTNETFLICMNMVIWDVLK